MTGCVLHALSGFPAPDAIECLDRWIRARRPHLRQTAIEGLAQVDYNQMDEPSAWRDWILGELRSVRETETVQEIIDLIDQSIAAIESSAETSGD
jgi:predicted metal-dependent hydrolase